MKITGLLKYLVEGDTEDINEMERNQNVNIGCVQINRLWVQCENCESLLYIRYLRENKHPIGILESIAIIPI
jgi:hypothetical protein